MAELKRDICYIKKALDKGEEEFAKNEKAHTEIIGKIDKFVEVSEARFLDKSEHIETLNRIDKFIDSANEKFAPIWVAKFLVWAGYIVGAIMLSGIIYLIAQAYLHLNK